MTDEGTLLCDEENECYPVAEASGVSSCLNGMPQGVPLPGVLVHGACGLITIRRAPIGGDNLQSIISRMFLLMTASSTAAITTLNISVSVAVVTWM